MHSRNVNAGLDRNGAIPCGRNLVRVWKPTTKSWTLDPISVPVSGLAEMPYAKMEVKKTLRLSHLTVVAAELLNIKLKLIENLIVEWLKIMI